ncbi:MAG: hypothetical protein IT291_08500 [Deltaproteobacteria bacterium]|nr:hypothetical protein [Deltaproteobacteria bacterium]
MRTKSLLHGLVVRRLVFLLVPVFYVFIFGLVEVFADSVVVPRGCLVTVRSLKASNGENRGHESISDLQEQLGALPFSSYEVIDSKQASLELSSRGRFDIAGLESSTHKVMVLPHFVADDQVQVTVDWQGPQGERLLSTKLKVVNNKSVVLGSDGNDDGSMILCVRVNCS